MVAIKYVTQAEAIENDKRLIEMGYREDALIELAGFSVFEVISHLVPEKNRVVVLVGPGNNGGDGLVAARLLGYAGYNVDVYCPRTKHPGLIKMCRNCKTVDSVLPDNYDTVVDAVFGFSFKPPVREQYSEILSGLPTHPHVISIDVPSGCEIDEAVQGAFRPAAVISVGLPKLCCRGLKCVYVARSFGPVECGFMSNYHGFIKL